MKGLVFDGIATSAAIDSSGEVLNVGGCDISDLAVHGLLNYEHLQANENKDRRTLGQEKVGKIVYAKKLLTKEDCTTDRQLHAWEALGGEIPCVYIVGRLFDVAGHDAAKALAASMRDQHAHGEKILLRLSVEGGTVKRDGQELSETYARDVALTYKPCNRTCDVRLLLDPGAPEGYDKAPYDAAKLQDLLGLAKTEDPAVFAAEENPLVPRFLALMALKKVLSVGAGNVAPDQLAGGAVLAVEDPRLAQARKLRTDYGEPFDKEEFARILRRHMPEVDDDFIDHFTSAGDQFDVPAKLLGKAETKRLYRATPYFGEDSCWAEEPHVAEAYTDNPGFGGSQVYEADVQPQHVLDVTGIGSGRMNLHLSRELYPDDDDDAHHERADRWAMAHKPFAPWESRPDMRRELGAQYSWIRYDDDYPEGAVTWARLDGDQELAPRPRAPLGKSEPTSSQPLMLGGQPVASNPHVAVPFVDLAAGALHTPRGTFACRALGDEAVRGLKERAAQPDVRAMHDPAMATWGTLEAAARNGTPSDALVRLVACCLEKPDEATRLFLVDLAARYLSDGPGAAETVMHLPAPAGQAREVVSLLGCAGVAPTDDPVLLADLFGLGDGDQATLDYLTELLGRPAARDLRVGVDRLWQRYLEPLYPGALPGAAWLHWLVVAPDSIWAVKGVGAMWTAGDPFGKSEDVLWELPRRCAEQVALWRHRFGGVAATLLALRYLVPRLGSYEEANDVRPIPEKGPGFADGNTLQV